MSVATEAVEKCLGTPGVRYSTPQQLKQAAAVLYEAGICTLCTLRFISIPLGPVYHFAPVESIYQALEILNPTKDVDGVRQPCRACLGVLDHEHVEQVVEKYKEQMYDVDDVFITVEIPKSIYIRHRAMQLFCADNSAILGSASDTIDVKEAIRYMISEQLSAACNVQMSGDSEMRVDIVFGHEESASEHLFLFNRDNSSVKLKTFRKKGVVMTTGDSKVAVLAELAACSEDEFRANISCPPPAASSTALVSMVTMKRSSLFVGGRYLKLKRNISQTPFVIDGRRITEDSVAEIIGEPIKLITGCESYNLVGSGREDADVRMLGNGRPFYIECINPRIKKHSVARICQIQDTLVSKNSPVQVRNLQIIQPNDTAIIKEGEEHKTKHYCALVWLSKLLTPEHLAELNSTGKQEMVIDQKTPIRVLHRRAPLTRPKNIISLEIEHLEGHFYRIRIESGAGTYIKEFVHGDLGRTVPSLASMTGATADILELDVENVSLDFPPPLSTVEY
ncbi:hypothetical protein H4R24_004928 [Coemansia sp. RSA 988]|nr:hypothetical protein H4R24_004928 [Coemansia sp. RSA 988]